MLHVIYKKIRLYRQFHKYCTYIVFLYSSLPTVYIYIYIYICVCVCVCMCVCVCVCVCVKESEMLSNWTTMNIWWWRGPTEEHNYIQNGLATWTLIFFFFSGRDTCCYKFKILPLVKDIFYGCSSWSPKRLQSLGPPKTSITWSPKDFNHLVPQKTSIHSTFVIIFLRDGGGHKEAFFRVCWISFMRLMFSFGWTCTLLRIARILGLKSNLIERRKASEISMPFSITLAWSKNCFVQDLTSKIFLVHIVTVPYDY